MEPIDDLNALAPKEARDMIPDPLGAIAEHDHRPQFGLCASQGCHLTTCTAARRAASVLKCCLAKVVSAPSAASQRARPSLVWPVPVTTASPAVVPPPLQPTRTRVCLFATLAQRLHATPLLAPRTPRRDRTRIRLQSRHGQSQYGFQQRKCHRTPRGQHAIPRAQRALSLLRA